ncbi:MAG: hypothetical protein HKP48_05175 [Winogradskyella sp.]|uniref:hypothetical protein n=1 Tax=Winogradskyella sp. TaxID=1883156 RepID=UPI0018592A82|nr:hypothetical protein [Winogradskyella sp.]NNK22690.1 hypothetical protein [Winogradskyella sp.]
MKLSIVALTFSAEGVMVCSKVGFKGIAGMFSLPMVMTGASKYLKYFFLKFP